MALIILNAAEAGDYDLSVFHIDTAHVAAYKVGRSAVNCGKELERAHELTIWLNDGKSQMDLVATLPEINKLRNMPGLRETSLA